VEKQVLLHSGRCQVIDDYDGEPVVENMAPIFEEGIRPLSLVLTSLKMDHLGSREYGDGCAVHWEVSSFKANNASCAIIFLKGGKHTHPSPTILYLKVQCGRLLG
jgi:diphthine-ammonia ligase